MSRLRRVVTGLDESGRSCVIIDGKVPDTGGTFSMIWQSDTIPVDNSGSADAAGYVKPSLFGGDGSNFMLIEFPPGASAPMHSTNTIDYIVVVQGQLVLELETGEVTLGPGDTLVDRGILHAWRNGGTDKVVFVCVTIPSHPVGPGGTM